MTPTVALNFSFPSLDATTQGLESVGPLSGLRGASVPEGPSVPTIAGVSRTIQSLYRVPQIVTLGRFPDARESDSTWRTEEVRHVGSDTIAPRFWCVPAAWFGEEDERRPSGPSASGARRNL